LRSVALEGATLFLPVSIGVRSNHVRMGAARPLLREKEGLWTYMGI
jgi:hypothetical protein